MRYIWNKTKATIVIPLFKDRTGKPFRLAPGAVADMEGGQWTVAEIIRNKAIIERYIRNEEFGHDKTPPRKASPRKAKVVQAGEQVGVKSKATRTYKSKRTKGWD